MLHSLKKSRVILSLVAFALVLATAAPIATSAATPVSLPEVRSANSSVSAVYGVVGYTISRDTTTVVVKLHRIDRKTVGTLVRRQTENPRTVSETISFGKSSFTSEFRQEDAEQVVTLTDRTDSVTLTLGPEDKEWIGDRQVAQEIFSRHARMLEMAEAVKDDIGIGKQAALASGKAVCTRSTAQSTGTVTTNRIDGPDLLCDDWPKCYSSAYGTRRSQACNNAKVDAAYCCTNDYCWGCCGFSPTGCDCMCIINPDYFCSCSTSGHKCFLGYPDW